MKIKNSGYNNLRLLISSGSTIVYEQAIEHASGLNFDTYYPGGLYGSLYVFIARDPTRRWNVDLGQKIQVYNRLTIVWEGRITGLVPVVSQDTQGTSITGIGYWGDVLMSRRLVKPWCDTRIGQDTWVWATSSSGAEKCTIDRNNRLRFTPKAVAWTNGQLAEIIYDAPAGQTIKRITFSYAFAEDTQAWELGLWNVTAGSSAWSVTSSGTGTQDITPATPTTRFVFYFTARNNQTPASDGTIYGQVSNLKVYTETGSINMTEIAKDVRAIATELSADEYLIESNTVTLEPFISNGDTLAEILLSAAGYGDSSYNPWSIGVRSSQFATDGKPVLYARAYPALTDYEYGIRLDENNLAGQVSLSQNLDDVRNYVIVRYQDENGYTKIATPEDDANLKDTTSISLYGERHEILTVNTSDATKAKQAGRRLLASRKDPQWRVDGDIRITGYIRVKQGQRRPVTEIYAGQRIKLENWLPDIAGDGLIILITSTSYDDATETVTIGAGQVDTLDVYLARLAAGRL